MSSDSGPCGNRRKTRKGDLRGSHEPESTLEFFSVPPSPMPRAAGPPTGRSPFFYPVSCVKSDRSAGLVSWWRAGEVPARQALRLSDFIRELRRGRRPPRSRATIRAAAHALKKLPFSAGGPADDSPIATAPSSGSGAAVVAARCGAASRNWSRFRVEWSARGASARARDTRD